MPELQGAAECKQRTVIGFQLSRMIRIALHCSNSQLQLLLKL